MPTLLRSIIFFSLLSWSVFRSSGQERLMAKYQLWDEDDDRIRVVSWYLKGETDLSKEWSMEVVGLLDSITGATPYGRPADSGSREWLAELEDERVAGIVSFSRIAEQYEHTFEFGYSDEPDYLSKTYGYSIARSLAEETLVLQAGLSFQDDRVDSSVPGGPGLGIRSKTTPELSIGAYRVLNPKTTLSLNLTWGFPKGYLSDPYKQIGLTETLFPGHPTLEREVFYMYPENRPDERRTFVLYTEATRYLEGMQASVEGSYRLFSDDASLLGHTIELKLLKRLGEKFVIQPNYRYYQQDSAEFYRTSLDGTSITPLLQPRGKGPHYSSDYRLSELITQSYGIKLTYFHKEDFSVDFSVDRYVMRGRDGITSQLFYPDARVLTIGFQWEF